MKIEWDLPESETPLAAVKSVARLSIDGIRRTKNAFSTMTGNMPTSDLERGYYQWMGAYPNVYTFGEAFTAGARFAEDYHMKKAQGELE
jgi:hypothetical protein